MKMEQGMASGGRKSIADARPEGGLSRERIGLNLNQLWIQLVNFRQVFQSVVKKSMLNSGGEVWGSKKKTEKSKPLQSRNQECRTGRIRDGGGKKKSKKLGLKKFWEKTSHDPKE